MSNYLAIATVTATLQRMLQASVQGDIDGARVTTVRPGTVGSGTPECGVNVFLYQVLPVVWRNADLPTRHQKGEIVRRPQVALDLNYIISFYGNEGELEPQRLLGSVVRTIHSRPELTHQAIQDTLADGSFGYLGESDLMNQVEVVRFAALNMTTDDLSKVWSVFFQTPYNLSMAYRASAVLIESEDIPQRALPVRERRLLVTPTQLRLERLLAQEDLAKVWRNAAEAIVLTTSTLALRGESLASSDTRIRINGRDFLPTAVTESQVTLALADLDPQQLRAGVQSLQLIHYVSQTPHRVLESNVLAFILRPRLIVLGLAEFEEQHTGLYRAQVRLQLNPSVGKNQLVVLVLNEATTTEPSAYSFSAPPRTEDGDTVFVPVQGVKAGRYLVRVRVAGAESLLTVDLDPTSATYEQYIGPSLEIPEPV